MRVPFEPARFGLGFAGLLDDIALGRAGSTSRCVMTVTPIVVFDECPSFL